MEVERRVLCRVERGRRRARLVPLCAQVAEVDRREVDVDDRPARVVAEELRPMAAQQARCGGDEGPLRVPGVLPLEPEGRAWLGSGIGLGIGLGVRVRLRLRLRVRVRARG